MSDEKQPQDQHNTTSNEEQIDVSTSTPENEPSVENANSDTEVVEVAPDTEEKTVEAPLEEEATAVSAEGITVTTEEVVVEAEEEASKDGEAPQPKKEEAAVQEVPKKEYETLSKEELLAEFETLLKNEKVERIQDHVDGIKSAINSLFDTEQEEARTKFLEEGGNIIDFRYFSPVKKAFNETYYEYRNKRAKYYQNRQKNLQENMDYRQGLIEELKALRNELGGAESVNTTFNKFKDLQERWHNAGNIPRDRYNLVWNNYYHHVDSFYELLHLNREFRDKHFQENLTKKLQLIERAEELTQESDINRAFKELQLLHRMWKEEIGPVSKEYSDDIWDKFSAATKKIHDARQEHIKNLEATYVKNLEHKKEIIDQMKAIGEIQITSHNGVQQKIKEIEALREQFFKAGKVPADVNEETWAAMKNAVRNFNHKKNDFYKQQKKEQYTNLAKKQELIKIAEEHKESEDFSGGIEIMKKIQADWKKIGHVPRKDSDKVWKQFKGACNHFFDRLHASKKQSNAHEEEAYVKKQELLTVVEGLEMSGDHKTDLDMIKGHIAQWKEIGRVPYSKKKIDEKFNKALDGLFGRLDMSKKEVEMMKYDSRMAAMAGDDNQRSLEKERFFITKKVEEIRLEINQLENNLGFFQHVADDNPLVKEVHKNIARHKDDLDLWKAKLKKIKAMF